MQGYALQVMLILVGAVMASHASLPREACDASNASSPLRPAFELKAQVLCKGVVSYAKLCLASDA
jgi:hypothetical protein